MISETRLEERLRQLIELRKKEEEEYGRLLTLLDQTCQVQLPEETETNFPRIKDALNQIWDISHAIDSAMEKEDRVFWKEVSRSFAEYLNPVVSQQREVNSVLVHLLNEYITAVHESLHQIRRFQSTLILYLQRIIPVIDTKFREMVGTAECFQIGFRDYIDALYQELDKKIETLQVDVSELKSAKDSDPTNDK
jgi:hypothetical protein